MNDSDDMLPTYDNPRSSKRVPGMATTTTSATSYGRPAFNEMDLDSLSWSQVITQLQANVNSRQPSERFFIFSGERQNKKIRLDIEFQHSIIEKIKVAGLTYEELAKTRASQLLYQDRIANILELERIKNDDELHKLKSEKFIRQQANEREHIDTQLRQVGLEKEHKLLEKVDVEIDKERAETENILAEAAIKRANAREAEARACKTEELNEMLKYIRTHKMDKLPPELDAFIVACQAGDPSAFGDFRMGDILRDFMQRKQEAETSKAEHDAKMREQEVEAKRKENEDKDINLQVKRSKLG